MWCRARTAHSDVIGVTIPCEIEARFSLGSVVCGTHVGATAAVGVAAVGRFELGGAPSAGRALGRAGRRLVLAHEEINRASREYGPLIHGLVPQ